MAWSWHNCKVWRAGPAENGVIYINLESVDSPKRFSQATWFKATQSMKTEMLAVALKAIETNKHVQVNLSDTAGYSTINRMYLRA